MSTSLIRRRFGVRLVAAVGALTLGLAATACSSEDDTSETGSAASSAAESTGEWPRTVETAEGPVTIESQPQRIVSTSVTLTGALLALDAPLYGTGAQPRQHGDHRVGSVHTVGRCRRGTRRGDPLSG